jgi:hypothetical protein
MSEEKKASKSLGKPNVKSGKAQQPSSQKGKTQYPKTDKSPAWWSFTPASVRFVQSARELSAALEILYGVNVSIAHYERMVREVQADKSIKELIHNDHKIIALYKRYAYDLEARNKERDIFRSQKAANTITGGLEVLEQQNAEQAGAVT